MIFRLQYLVRGLMLQLKEEETLRIDLNGPHSLSVDFRIPTAAERDAGYAAEDGFCTVSSEREPSTAIRAMFQSLAENQLPPGSHRGDSPFDHEYITEDLRFKAGLQVPLRLLPKPIQSFVTDLESELHRSAIRTVAMLRWRYRMPGNPTRPFSTQGTRWSFDGDAWHLLPGTTKVRAWDMGWLWVREPTRSQVEEMLRGGIDEPLGQELFREAWSLSGESPRSALLMGIAAAEAGLKQYIVAVHPDTRWIVEHLPSPPLVQMLTDYLPKLPVQPPAKQAQTPPAKLIETIRKGVNIRNTVAHVGGSLAFETVEEILLAVRDVLWMLDYYAGHSWALDYVREDVKGAWLAE
jgi:hypothetical protein